MNRRRRGPYVAFAWLTVLLLCSTAVAAGDPAIAPLRGQLFASFDRMIAAWGRFETGAATAAATLDALRPEASLASGLAEDLGRRRGPVSTEQMALVDLARSIANLSTILTTVGEFHALLGPQTSQVGEATDQLRTAKRLIDEIAAARSGKLAKLRAGAARKPGPATQYVFVLLIDTLRADHVGTYGYVRATTPNLDRLAGEGIVVEEAVSQSSLTNTSVASLLTSLYPGSHRMVGKADWYWKKSWVADLRARGFSTGAVTANPIITRDEHFDYGFDSFVEVPWCRAPVVLNEARRSFDRARAEHDKVFTYIHLMDPHDVYLPPSPFLEKFSRSRSFRAAAYWVDWMIENEFPKLAATDPECAFDPGREKWGQGDLLLRCLSKLDEGISLSRSDIDNLVDRYDGEIAYVDHEIGRFVEYLEAIGVLPQTTIVVVSDHGEAFFEHNRLRHGRELYQTQVRVPLIVWRGDGSLEPRRISGLVELVDVMPSLYDLLSLEGPPRAQGRSFLSASKGRPYAHAMSWNGRELASRRHVELHTALSRDFKYIRVSDPARGGAIRDEFYALGDDPEELHDVRSKYPKEFDELRDQLTQWLEKTSVSAPAKMGAPVSEAQRERLRALGYVD